MSTRFAGRAASASVALMALTVLLTGCSSPGSPTAEERQPAAESSAPPSPSPSQTGCPNPYGGSCLGPVDAGEYRTTTFTPRITYTVPEGWTNFEDLIGNFALFRQEDADGQLTPRGGSFLGIFSNVHAPAIDCREAWQEGVGTTPAELVAWYQSLPGLIVAEPVEVTVGGLEGLQVDLELEEGDDTCTFDGNDGIPLIMGDGVSSLHHVILDEMDIRLVLLEWGDGGNIALEITNTREQHNAEEFRSLVQPIVDSLVFEQ